MKLNIFNFYTQYFKEFSMNMNAFLNPFYQSEMISRSGKATKAHFVCFADELKDALFKEMIRHPFKLEPNMAKKVK